jgi:hypothetical protein
MHPWLLGLVQVLLTIQILYYTRVPDPVHQSFFQVKLLPEFGQKAQADWMNLHKRCF